MEHWLENQIQLIIKMLYMSRKNLFQQGWLVNKNKNNINSIEKECQLVETFWWSRPANILKK